MHTCNICACDMANHDLQLAQDSHAFCPGSFCPVWPRTLWPIGYMSSGFVAGATASSAKGRFHSLHCTRSTVFIWRVPRPQCWTEACDSSSSLALTTKANATLRTARQPCCILVSASMSASTVTETACDPSFTASPRMNMLRWRGQETCDWSYCNIWTKYDFATGKSCMLVRVNKLIRPRMTSNRGARKHGDLDRSIGCVMASCNSNKHDRRVHERTGLVDPRSSFHGPAELRML